MQKCQIINEEWHIQYQYCCICNLQHFKSHFPPGSPALTGTGTIAVTVDDVNDNVPTFAFKMYSTTIPEDAPTGTDILLVNSSDADASINAVIRYGLYL